MAQVDVVVVSFNSRAALRSCVEPLASGDDFRVIVVDNNSSDGSLDAAADLDIHRIPLKDNRGFPSDATGAGAREAESSCSC